MRTRSAFLLALLAAGPLSAKDLRILVSGIESDQGEIACLLFQEEQGFPNRFDSAFTQVTYPAVTGMLTCTFPDVEPGRYAVSVVHDENGNKKIDTSFIGTSKEPWGVTNNVRPERRSPRFSEAAIWVSATQMADYEVAVSR
jgi:uncharacterized protein (DUF2141 family)